MTPIDVPKDLKEKLKQTATVIALQTPDGLMGFEAQISLGETFIIYPVTIKLVKAYNTDKRQLHRKIMVLGEKEEYLGLVPVECLTWTTKEKDLRLFNTLL